MNIVLKTSQDFLEQKKILIVDKKGLLGKLLAKGLHNFDAFKVTLVSNEVEKYSKIEQVLFISRIPKIPQRRYSHIFIFYNGEEEILESIPVFISEAEKISAKLILVIPVNINSKQFLTNLSSSYKNIFIILVGDIFGEGIFLNNRTLINQFLLHSKNKNRIVIEGTGFEKTFPVFSQDAVDKILEVAFVKNNPGFFLLFTRHALTQLSLAHVFHKIDPQIRIDFSLKNNKVDREDIFIPQNGEYLLDEMYSLFPKIKQAMNDINKSNNIQDWQDEKKKTFFLGNALKKGLYVIILSLFISIFSTGFFSLLGAWQLQSARNSINNGNFSLARSQVNYSKTFFSYAQDIFSVFLFETSFIGKREELGELMDFAKKGRELSDIAGNLLDGLNNFTNVFSGKTPNANQEFSKGLDLTKSAIASLQKLSVNNNIGEIFPKSLSSSQNLLMGTIDVFPRIFGMEGERRYLLLFQNNMELRPGGGFIGSYGIFSLNKGSVKDFAIHDVYEADGQLKGHVEPPFAIRRHMSIVHWYLRDSNFFVDYPRNASISAFFLSQETGETVDGVIGVDLTFVKRIIAALGAVYVPEYKETVTEDNFYLLTQSHAEKNFFPGSRQKRDFLQALFNALQRSFLEKKNISYIRIAEALSSSIAEKHLLFSFSDPSVQNLFTVNNLSSSLWDGRKEKDNVINDFLGINEANIGINKANYFIKRKVIKEVKIDNDGKVSNKLTIMYKNTNGVWPGGEYKNYIQLILPQGSTILSAAIDGSETNIVPAITDFSVYEAKNFEPPQGLEVDSVEENGKNIFGFLITVPVEKIKTITISYELAKKLSTDQPLITYSLMLFKQPGVDQYLFDFFLQYPEAFKILNGNEKFTSSRNNLKSSINILKDLNLSISFAKK